MGKRMGTIACCVALLAMAMCGSASASQITQYSLATVPYAGASFNIDTYGQLDWVIAGVNEKAGGTMVSSTGTGGSTILVSTTAGGNGLDSKPLYPYFTYNDGALPTSSAASGDSSKYQYDNPAVDVSVPAGLTRLAFWTAQGNVNSYGYKATLADGTTTGATALSNSSWGYLLQLDVQSDVAQKLTFTIDHTGGYNAGLFAVAANPVPIPGAILLFAPGLVGLTAIRRRFKK